MHPSHPNPPEPPPPSTTPAQPAATPARPSFAARLFDLLIRPHTCVPAFPPHRAPPEPRSDLHCLFDRHHQRLHRRGTWTVTTLRGVPVGALPVTPGEDDSGGSGRSSLLFRGLMGLFGLFSSEDDSVARDTMVNTRINRDAGRARAQGGRRRAAAGGRKGGLAWRDFQIGYLRGETVLRAFPGGEYISLESPEDCSWPGESADQTLTSQSSVSSQESARSAKVVRFREEVQVFMVTQNYDNGESDSD